MRCVEYVGFYCCVDYHDMFVTVSVQHEMILKTYSFVLVF